MKQKNNDRKTIASHRISDAVLLDQKYPILDYKVVISHLKNGGRLSTKQIVKIISDGCKFIGYQQNIVQVNKPTFIVGSIHGHFRNLISIFDTIDFNEIQRGKKVLIFTGNYINIGTESINVLLTLILIKTHFPNSVYLLRGQEESFCKYARGTFKKECLKHYNRSVYSYFVELLYFLPVASILDKDVFISNQGTPIHKTSINFLNKINRFVKVPLSETLYQILVASSGSGKQFLSNLNLTQHVMSDNDEKRILQTNYVERRLKPIYSLNASILLYENKQFSNIRLWEIEEEYLHPEYLNGIEILVPNILENLREFEEQINTLIELMMMKKRKHLAERNSTRPFSSKTTSVIDSLQSISHQPLSQSKEKNQNLHSTLESDETIREIIKGIREKRGKAVNSHEQNDCTEDLEENGENISIGDYTPILSSISVIMSAKDENEEFLSEKERNRIKKKGLKNRNSFKFFSK